MRHSYHRDSTSPWRCSVPFPTAVSVEGEEQGRKRWVRGPVVRSGLAGLTAAVEDQPILEGLQTGAEPLLLRCGPTHCAIWSGQEFIPNVPKAANGLKEPRWWCQTSSIRVTFIPFPRVLACRQVPPRRVGAIPPVQLVDPVDIAAPEHFAALERLPGGPNNARFRRGATELSLIPAGRQLRIHRHRASCGGTRR